MLSNSKQHLSAYFMPGSVLSNNALMLIYWVLTATVWSIRLSPFPGWGKEAQRGWIICPGSHS